MKIIQINKASCARTLDFNKSFKFGGTRESSRLNKWTWIKEIRSNWDKGTYQRGGKTKRWGRLSLLINSYQHDEWSSYK